MYSFFPKNLQEKSHISLYNLYIDEFALGFFFLLEGQIDNLGFA